MNEEFTDHINSLNPHIKFTIEEEIDGKLPFLDTCIILEDDGSLNTKVYRKPTHTDQYLNWSSNRHLEHKRSVVRTLLDRVETIVSKQNDKKEEIKHVKKVLSANGYKKWALEIPKKKKSTNNENSDKEQTIGNSQCAYLMLKVLQRYYTEFLSHMVYHLTINPSTP